MVDEGFSNFVLELLETLCKSTEYEEYSSFFFQFLPNLILDVAFVQIRTTTEERQQMYDDPQEFVNLALDTCEAQKSKTIKTQAAKLFESLVDNIPGALTLIVYYSLASMNYVLSQESGNPPADLSMLAKNLEDTQI